MIYKTMALNGLIDGWTQSDAETTLTLYMQEPTAEIDAERTFPCVVICPGGGYEFTSAREAEPVALRYAAKGYSAVVLRYSTGTKRFPIQLCEVSMTLAWLRRNCAALHLCENKIAVCGFSAGGHVAASLSNLYDLPAIRAYLSIAPEENKPNAAVLCYPVITSGAFAHRGSFEHLIDAKTDAAMQEKISLENSVHANCPPTFLWHTADDTCVPVENSLLYAMALRRFQIPLEMHVFLSGVHGLSLADSNTTNVPEGKQRDIAEWFDMSVRFLDRIFALDRF